MSTGRAVTFGEIMLRLSPPGFGDYIGTMVSIDDVGGGQIEVVYDGIGVDKIQNRPAIDLHAEYWLRHGVPGSRSEDMRSWSRRSPPRHRPGPR